MPPGRMGSFGQVAGGRRRQAVGRGIVGRGDEDDRHEREDGEDEGPERQEADALGDRGLAAGLSGDVAHGKRPRQVQVHAVVAEHGVEESAAEGAKDQHAEDQLPHRPAAGDAGHEQAHEGSVGDPPGPVEDGHVLDEAGTRDRVRPGVQPNEVLEHQPDGVRAGAQQEVGRADDQDEGEQDDRGEDRAVGERLDAPFEPEVDAGREQGDADEQDRHLKPEGLFDAQDFADAGRHHRRPESE